MVQETRSNLFSELKKSDLQRETEEILRERKLGLGLPSMRPRNHHTKIVRVAEKKKERERVTSLRNGNGNPNEMRELRILTKFGVNLGKGFNGERSTERERALKLTPNER